MCRTSQIKVKSRASLAKVTTVHEPRPSCLVLSYLPMACLDYNHHASPPNYNLSETHSSCCICLSPTCLSLIGINVDGCFLKHTKTFKGSDEDKNLPHLSLFSSSGDMIFSHIFFLAAGILATKGMHSLRCCVSLLIDLVYAMSTPLPRDAPASIGPLLFSRNPVDP